MKVPTAQTLLADCTSFEVVDDFAQIAAKRYMQQLDGQINVFAYSSSALGKKFRSSRVRGDRVRADFVGIRSA